MPRGLLRGFHAACLLITSSISYTVSNMAASVMLSTYRADPNTVELPISQRNPPYSNYSLMVLHVGHVDSDFLFSHWFGQLLSLLPCSVILLAILSLQQGTLLLEGLLFWIAYLTPPWIISPALTSSQHEFPMCLSEILISTLPWFFPWFLYNSKALFPSFLFLLFPPLQHNPHEFRNLILLPLHPQAFSSLHRWCTVIQV